MPKTATLPAASDAVELLTRALREGHVIALSLATEPRVIRASPAVTACCLRFGMTPSESRILMALVEHGFVGSADLHAAMSRDSYTVSNIKTLRVTLRVVVCAVRRKLKAHNIRIITVWNEGYRLGEKDRDRIREMLAEYDAANSKPETGMKSATP